jgi:hypothetical protein
MNFKFNVPIYYLVIWLVHHGTLFFLPNVNFFAVGLFNVCDKVLLAFEILLEWREYFKRGVPISSAIESKVEALSKHLMEVK